MNNEDPVAGSQDQRRGWYATRAWHCSNGELACVRVYLPCESPELPEDLSRDV